MFSRSLYISLVLASIALKEQRLVESFTVNNLPGKQSLQKSSNLICHAADSVEATVEKDTISASKPIEFEEKRRLAKSALLGLIGEDSNTNDNYKNVDPILVDPVTKDDLKIVVTTGTRLGGQTSSGIGYKVALISKDNIYEGRTNTYYNLLRKETTEAEKEDVEQKSTENKMLTNALRSLQVFIPPPVRPVLSATGVLPGYVPMRDLFTSPSVSFAYERGWRQGFASAGFPGADKEYEMVKEFFMPIKPKVVVDMSCATGTFFSIQELIFFC